MERTAEFGIANDAAEDVHDIVHLFLQGRDVVPAQGQEGLQARGLRLCLARFVAVLDEVQDLGEGLEVLSTGSAPLEVGFKAGGRVDPVAKPAYEIGVWTINGG